MVILMISKVPGHEMDPLAQWWATVHVNSLCSKIRVSEHRFAPSSSEGEEAVQLSPLRAYSYCTRIRVTL